MPLFGTPKVEKLRAKGDFKGLMKATRHDDPSIRAFAMDATVQVAQDAKTEIERERRTQTVMEALAGAVAQGDTAALDTIAKTWAGEFGGGLEYVAEDALQSTGPAVGGALLTLLDRPDNYVRMRAANVLGRIGDLSTLRPIVTLGVRTDPDEASWAGELRQACGVACMNMYKENPDEYRTIMSEVPTDEREFMEAMMGYVDSGFGRR